MLLFSGSHGTFEASRSDPIMVSGFSDTSNGIIKVSRFDLMMLQGFSVKKEPTQFTGMKPMKAVLQAK